MSGRYGKGLWGWYSSRALGKFVTLESLEKSCASVRKVDPEPMTSPGNFQEELEGRSSGKLGSLQEQGAGSSLSCLLPALKKMSEPE